jgi:hypothetical protein
MIGRSFKHQHGIFRNFKSPYASRSDFSASPTSGKLDSGSGSQVPSIVSRNKATRSVIILKPEASVLTVLDGQWNAKGMKSRLSSSVLSLSFTSCSPLSMADLFFAKVFC